MYGMSAASISSKELAKCTFTYNTVLWKLFRIKNKEDVKFVQYFFNYLDFSNLLNHHCFCFLNKLNPRGLLVNGSRIDEADLSEMFQLSKRFNLLRTDSNNTVMKKIWNTVELEFVTGIYYLCTLLSYFVVVVVHGTA